MFGNAYSFLFHSFVLLLVSLLCVCIIHVFTTQHDYRYNHVFLMTYFLFFLSLLLSTFSLFCVHLFLITHHDYPYNRAFLITYFLFFLYIALYIISLFFLLINHVSIVVVHVDGKHRSPYIILFHASVLILRYSYVIRLRHLASCLMRARMSCTHNVYMHMNKLFLFLDISY